LSAEPPRTAEGRNLCEEFDLAEVVVKEDDLAKRKAKEAFDRLFRKK
jgi:hypothetical protein